MVLDGENRKPEQTKDQLNESPFGVGMVIRDEADVNANRGNESSGKKMKKVYATQASNERTSSPVIVIPTTS